MATIDRPEIYLEDVMKLSTSLRNLKWYGILTEREFQAAHSRLIKRAGDAAITKMPSAEQSGGAK